MKLRHKFYAIVAALLMTFALGLAACGEKAKRFSVKAEFDATQGSVILSGEGAGDDGTYAEDASVTVTVTPNADYEVETFTVNGKQTSLSADGKYTFTVKEDTTVKATFALKPVETFSVTLVKQFTDEMGTASLSAPKNGEKYEKDELVTLTVSVNSGYLLESVTVGGEPVELEGGKYSFKARSDTEVTVSMRAVVYYTVTWTGFTEEEGSVNFSPAANADGKYREGTNVTFTVTPGKRYSLKSVKADGEELVPVEDVYSFSATKDTVVEVLFEQRTTFHVSVSLDEKMCDVTYIGSDGQAPSLKAGADFKDGTELLVTVVLNGGYKLVSATVNDKPAELSGNGFSVTVSEDLSITVLCRWDVTGLQSLTGEYTLKDDTWYSFTLSEGTVFEFSADTYMGYAAVYQVAQVAEPGKDEKPVWVFSDTNHAFHAFEAGTYVARLSSNTGDGTATTKLTVTPIPYLGFEINGFQATSFVSLDGKYKLYMDTHYLAVKDKDGNAVDVKVTRTTDDKGVHTYVELGGKTYSLGTRKAALSSGDATSPTDGLIASLFIQEGSTVKEQIDFRPDPLPKDVTIAQKLAGTYTGTTFDTDQPDGGNIPVDGDLVVRGNTIKWGEKEITLLRSLAICSTADEIPENLSIGYCGEEIFLLFAILNGNVYQIRILSDSYKNQITFSPKKDDGTVTIDQKYWGTWVGTGTLNGYRFVIEEHNITITKDGQPVETKLGKYESKGGTYPTFTLDGVEYYLGTVVRGSISVSAVANGKFLGTITARWTVTVQAEHANVAIENQQNEYVNNAKITFTVTAETGYTVSAVKQNGKALTAGTDGKYSFNISANTVITVECEPAPSAAADLPFAENFIGEWKNADLYLKLEQNSITLRGADGSALPYTVGTAKYGSQRYNSVKLDGTTYVFLKAEGT